MPQVVALQSLNGSLLPQKPVTANLLFEWWTLLVRVLADMLSDASDDEAARSYLSAAIAGASDEAEIAEGKIHRIHRRRGESVNLCGESGESLRAGNQQLTLQERVTN